MLDYTAQLSEYMEAETPLIKDMVYCFNMFQPSMQDLIQKRK